MKSFLTQVGSFIILFFSLFTVFLTFWLFSNFGLLSFDKIIFHMFVPLEGAQGEFTFGFILVCLLIPITITVFLFLVKQNYFHPETKIQLVFFNKKFSFRVFPFQFLFKRFMLNSTILLFLSILFFLTNLGIKDIYNHLLFESNFYADNYKDPKRTKIFCPNKKQNLIVIFMESMETTYQSNKEGGANSENLIPELSRLAEENINFSYDKLIGGTSPVTGTSWTIAAIFSYFSGIPLILPMGSNSMEQYANFFPSVITLGDILEESGYSQTFLIGSDKKFSGRDKYFTNHGNFTIKDIEYFKKSGKIPKDYNVWWGFEDQKLYPFAKEELLTLSQSKKPFHLTLLTTDTHHIGGYVCEKCHKQHIEQYSNVIACASKQVYEFVTWIKKQNFYPETTIVIVGDHLSMDPEFFDNLDPSYQRKMYNVIINSKKKTQFSKNRQFTPFDFFPTILESLGFEIEGGRLALGQSLFNGEKTLVETYGFGKLNEELARNSFMYNKLVNAQNQYALFQDEK